ELARGDVLEHENDMLEVPGVVLLARETYVTVHDLSVLGLESLLHRVVADLPAAQQLPLLDVDLEILEMAHIGVGPDEQLGFVVSQDLDQPLVHREPVSAGREPRDADPRVLEGAAVARLAGRQIELSPPAPEIGPPQG